MPGESQETTPDPTVLTTEQMLLAIENLEKLTLTARVGGFAIVDERIESIERELAIKEIHRNEISRIVESHRLELKADNQKTVDTAMIAAEKAVQAALAAAEKARDQQTIASQLATTKAEVSSKEQMGQQGYTSTLAISGLTTGLNDLKALVGEIRAEIRGGTTVRTETRDARTDRRSDNTLLVAVLGTFFVALSLGLGIAALFLGR